MTRRNDNERTQSLINNLSESLMVEKLITTGPQAYN
jgi:hypothetical protein